MVSFQILWPMAMVLLAGKGGDLMARSKVGRDQFWL